MIGPQDLQAAVSQILNDSFFQNPAKLSLVNKLQLLAGVLNLTPNVQFIGTSYGNTGKVTSNVNDSLPYLLTAYRFTDQFVFGINMTPSAYSHISWPVESFINQTSTLTQSLYYRVGAQSSYQVTSKLSLGIGFNLEYNKLLEINYVVPGSGNQVNKVSARHFTTDVGLFYKINPTNFLTVAVYQGVNSLGRGISSVKDTTVTNFAATLAAAPVAYIGLQNILTDKWSTEEKIYWSGWSVQKNLTFSNSATGSFILPLHWRDVWSIQLSSRYAATEKFALLGSLMYDTNPVQTTYNKIGYPLSSVGSIGGGVDITLQKELSLQLVYSYGTFLPNSPINNANSVGFMPFKIQAVTIQLTYKL